MPIDFGRLRAASDAFHQRCYDASCRFVESDFATGLKVGTCAAGLLWGAVALDRCVSGFLHQKTGFPFRAVWMNAGAPIVAGALAGGIASKVGINPKWLSGAASALTAGFALVSSEEEPPMLCASVAGSLLFLFYWANLKFQGDFVEAQRIRAEGGIMRVMARDAIHIADVLTRPPAD